MNSIRWFAAMLLILMMFPMISSAELAVQTKDMDGVPVGHNWRRIAVLITNNGDETDMSSLTVTYILDELSADGLASQNWYYVVHSADWSVQGGTVDEVSISFVEKNDFVYVTLNFADRILPANGQAEIQFGVHYTDWQMIDESSDPSYIQSTQYVDNSAVAVETDIPMPLEPNTCGDYYCHLVQIETMHIDVSDHIQISTTGDENALSCSPFGGETLRIQVADAAADMLHSATERAITEGMPVNISLRQSSVGCLVDKIELH